MTRSHFGNMTSSLLFFVFAFSFVIALAAGGQVTTALMKPTSLLCESLTAPLGIDTPKPALSWRLQDGRWGAKQTAYEITVYNKVPTAASRPDVWDSRRIQSDQSVDVHYDGPTLGPEKRYYWRVQAWDKDGKAYPASDVSWWETGLLS